MKTNLALVVLVNVILTSCIDGSFVSNDGKYNTTNKDFSFTEEFSVSTPAVVKIATSAGDITATTANSNKVEVAFVVRKDNKVLDITLEQLKELAQIEIINDTNKLEINVKKMFERRMSVGFIIKTPKQTSCNFVTSGGDITLTGVKGNQNIVTSGGDLIFSDISGNITTTTSGGDIKISKTVATINASTSGGDIQLNNIDGNTVVSTSGGDITANTVKPMLQAHTSGGDINLQSVIGSVDVGTSGGDVRLLNIEGSTKANTSGGDIEAGITKLTGEIVLETSGGDVKATIPKGIGITLNLSGESVDTQLSNFTGTAKRDRIKGDMNGGGTLVQLSTYGGSVKLDYK